jgi:hypothetical protein
MKTHPAYRNIEAAFNAVGADLKKASDDQINFIAKQLDLAFKKMAGQYMSQGYTLQADYVFNKVGKTRVRNNYGGRGKPKKHRMKPKLRKKAA